MKKFPLILIAVAVLAVVVVLGPALRSSDAGTSSGGALPLPVTVAAPLPATTATPGPLPTATPEVTPTATPARVALADPYIAPDSSVQLIGDTLVPFGGAWKYRDDGSDQGDAWSQPGFNDSRWPSGRAELGYGDLDEQTVIGYGPNYDDKFVTSYFRRTFAVPAPEIYTSLRLRLRRDDGAVVYLNGVEVFRTNMAPGPVNYRTYADFSIWDAEETRLVETNLGPQLLVAGVNVLAVEVHQATPASSDLSFDLELAGITHLAFISQGATWRYLDGGADPGPGWSQPGYDDHSWPKGRAEFGYGEGDEATVIDYGPDPEQKAITTYFRHVFQINEAARYGNALTLSIKRDDGAVVYFNGVEVFRTNMPDGPIDRDSRASRSVWGDEQTRFHETTIDPALLREGDNVLAVEVHQNGPHTTDMSFDLALLYDTTPPSVPVALAAPAVMPDTLFIDWPDSLDGIGVAAYKLFRDGVFLGTTAESNFTDSGLQPGATYTYRVQAVDTAGNTSEQSQPFTIATSGPVATCAGSLRFAVIGDYGFAGPEEADVAALVKSWQPDFIISAGDNNYLKGEASTIDENVGQYYHDYISPYRGGYGPGAGSNRFFPALGGHDWLSENGRPYFDYFTLPGNERYYEVRQGPVHLFILDSEGYEPDGTSASSPQAEWLRQALAASDAPWKLVIVHRPPFSSGDRHGSNSMVQWPYGEWGATAVISGDEHVYERLSVNGLPYLVNGLSGAPWRYGFTSPVAGSQVRFNGDYGAIRVEAATGCLSFEFITRAGLTIDRLTLP